MNKKPILFYDSECGLCSRFQKALELLDQSKKVDYRSIHEVSVYLDFPELDPELCLEEIHLIDVEGRIHRGGEVIEFLITIYPGVQKFAWLLDSESGKKAVNVFYKQINRMREMKKRNCFTCGKGRKDKRS